MKETLKYYSSMVVVQAIVLVVVVVEVYGYLAPRLHALASALEGVAK